MLLANGKPSGNKLFGMTLATWATRSTVHLMYQSCCRYCTAMAHAERAADSGFFTSRMLVSPQKLSSGQLVFTLLSGLIHQIKSAVDNSAGNEGSSRLQLWQAEAQLVLPFRGLGQAWQFCSAWRGQYKQTPLIPQDHFAIGSRSTERSTTVTSSSAPIAAGCCKRTAWKWYWISDFRHASSNMLIALFPDSHAKHLPGYLA